MTEDKTDKALRKVTVNLIPEELANKPHPESDLLKIDISDKLDKDKSYRLDSISVEKNGTGSQTYFVSMECYNQFKISVETILDAVIVNSKQRESAQRLVDSAFYGNMV